MQQPVAKPHTAHANKSDAANTSHIQKVQEVCILGATGSIGCSTLDVLSRHPNLYTVFAISGHRQITKLAEQISQFHPKYAVVLDDKTKTELKGALSGKASTTEILVGHQALVDIASAPEVDIVMSAIVGAAGLLPSIAAVKAGKKVLLANKEALVMSGEIFMNAVKQHKAQLLPIDSEHNAIFQALPHDYIYGDKQSSGISHLLLTGSGGPFKDLPLKDFGRVTPQQACKHPNWSMGKKISVDSASMMNKGLEFIEAKWLFGVHEDDIKVVIHPQSTIHSMVQYIDGSVIAQLGNPDMRTPIAHGLAYPNRMDSGVAPVDFAALSSFTFSEPCKERFPNLYLAMQASKQGQSATTALNAANEVAVDAFLEGKINFLHINEVNQGVLAKMSIENLPDIDSILAFDEQSRHYAHQLVNQLAL